MLRLNRRRKTNSLGHGTGLVFFDALRSMSRSAWTATHAVANPYC